MEWPATPTSESVMDPLDMVETILSEEQLEFERTAEGDICFTIPGSWKPFEMWFTWHEPGEALQLCGALGVGGIDEGGLEALSRDRRLELYELLALVNQRVWFGHFELYQEDPAAKESASPTANRQGLDVIFRHALSVTGAEPVSMVQTAHMVNRAAEAMDGFYPAFDLWLKGKVSARDALEACLFETVGEA